MWRAIALALILPLVGCNTWSRYYIDTLGKPVEQAEGLKPFYGNPVVVCTDDIGSGIQRMRAAAYEPIGFSVFDDAEVVDVDGAVVHATQISAAVVLIYTRYPHAFCGGLASQVGKEIRTSVVTSSVASLDVVAPADSEDVGAARLFRLYSDKFAEADYVAAYFARRQTLYGAHLSDLDEDDVYDLGAMVTALIPRSPCARAGVQLGDIITFVGGVEMLDTWHITESVEHAAGPEISIRVLREGDSVDLTLRIPEQEGRGRR